MTSEILPERARREARAGSMMGGMSATDTTAITFRAHFARHLIAERVAVEAGR